MDMGQPLPDFTDPPVVEVALSVQFDPLTELRTPQIGLLWADYRKRAFSKTEEHPPLDPVIERFGVPTPPRAQFQLLSTPPVSRVWFVNAPGTELVQVQQDRFIHNWRKVGDADTYPRYEHVRETFEAELKRFAEFVRSEGVGELRPNQCEVTYVNHVVPGDAWKQHGELGAVVTVFSPRFSDTFLKDPEDARIRLRFVIPDSGGEPCGRLHIAVEPAYPIGGDQPIFVMNLTARGRPDGEGLDGALRFMDRGREWVVRGFASITTSKMHAVWRRQDAHHAQ